MPNAFVDRFTPRVSPRTQLLAAGCVWSLMGALLCIKGVYAVRASSLATVFCVCVLGVILGVTKSCLVFDRAAAAIIRRIRQKPALTCLGGLFSVRNWMLIAAMMLLGKTISWLPLAMEWKGLVSVLVGSGLAYSSRMMWAAWKLTPGMDIGDLRRG